MNILRHAYPNELYHHGIKGQKWGVRRYQNPDGSLTAAGKERYKLMGRARRRNVAHHTTTADVNSIVQSLSLYEKKLLGAHPNEDWIDPEYEYQTSPNIAKRYVTKYGNMPVSFIEVWDNGGNIGEIALATRRGSEYRGKGLASNNVKQIMEWYDRYGYKNLDSLQWNVARNNAPSLNLAKKYGFKEVSLDDYPFDKKYYDEYAVLKYKKKSKVKSHN